MSSSQNNAHCNTPSHSLMLSSDLGQVLSDTNDCWCI